MHLQRTFPLLATLALVAPGIASPADVTVGPTDKAGFQAAVDAASMGDKLACLGGQYDFTAPGAVMLTKGLEIVAANAGDPPIFEGLMDMTGGPVQGTNGLDGNTAFAVPPGTVLDGLKLQGLHFTGFERTIYIQGFDLTTADCTTPVPGDVRNVSLIGNEILNSVRGITLAGGPLEGYRIADNVVDLTGVLGGTMLAPASVFVAGDFVNCPGSVIGPNAPEALVRPRNGTIENNLLVAGEDTRAAALVLTGALNATVKSNVLVGLDAAIVLQNVRAQFPWIPLDPEPIDVGTVTDNFITGEIGIVLVGSTLTEGTVKDNTFASILFMDVLFPSGGNGYTVKDNTYSGTGFVATVLLQGSSFDNTIKVGPEAVVQDLGTNNTVIVE